MTPIELAGAVQDRVAVEPGASALAGVDAWTGGGGPAAELGALVEVAPSPAASTWAWGRLEMVGDPAGPVPIDGLGAGGSAWFGPWLGGTVAGSGSVTTGWAEAVATADLRARTGLVAWSLSAGAGARDGGGLVPSGRLAGGLRATLGPWTSETRLRLSVYGGPLPPVAVDGGTWVEAGDRLQVAVGVTGSGVPRSGAVAAPGLPPPGALVARGTLAGTWRWSRRTVARVEVAPELELGVAPYWRVRTMAGLEVDLGRTRETPRVVGAGVRFAIRAPEAQGVDLIGAFNGWDPIVLHRSRGGWWDATVPVPSGRWEYAYRVDGVARVPPEADRRVDDGMGGQDGILDVP